MSDLFQNMKATIESLTTKAPEAAKALKAMIDEYGGVQNFVAEISKDLQNQVKSQLKEKGVSEKAKAWIEDGKKLALSNEQVQKLMGDERIKKVAEKLKTTPDRLATLLGEALPPLLEKFEAAKAAIDSASKSMPADSFVGGILKKVSGFFGNPPPKA